MSSSCLTLYDNILSNFTYACHGSKLFLRVEVCKNINICFFYCPAFVFVLKCNIFLSESCIYSCHNYIYCCVYKKVMKLNVQVIVFEVLKSHCVEIWHVAGA